MASMVNHGSWNRTSNFLSHVLLVGRLVNHDVTPLQTEDLEAGTAKVNEMVLDELIAPATGRFGCLKGAGVCAGIAAGFGIGAVIIGIGTQESFIETFMDYIQDARSEYLSPHIIWRFESKQIS